MSGRTRCVNCARGFTFARNRRAAWMDVDGLGFVCGVCQDVEAVGVRIRELHAEGHRVRLVFGDSLASLRWVTVDAIASAPKLEPVGGGS